MAAGAVPGTAQDAVVNNTTELLAAIADGGVTTIQLNAGTYLLSAEIDLNNETKELTGVGTAIIDGQSSGSRIFDLNNNAVLVLDNLTLQNGSTSGNADGGLARIRNGSSITIRNSIAQGHTSLDNGGAIQIAGTGSSLTVDNSTFSGNSTTDNGGAILANGAVTVVISNTTFESNTAGNGGGVWVGDDAVVTISGSTFRANQATLPADGDGGGLFQAGTASSVQLTNVTFDGNTAVDRGGAAVIRNGALVRHVTATNNTAIGRNGGAFDLRGGGITLQNSIIFGNSSATTPADIRGGGSNVVTSNGGNVVGDCNVCTPTGNDTSTDPGLGPLANNGGPTLTREILATSSAADIGADLGIATDQTGAARNQGAAPDAGAFESTPIPTVEVTPDLPAPPISVLPGVRSQDFTVTNTSFTTESINVTASVAPGPAPFLNVDSISVDGAAATTGASATLGPLAASGAATVTVFVTAAYGSAAAEDTLVLDASVVSAPTATDQGSVAIARTAPTLTVTPDGLGANAILVPGEERSQLFQVSHDNDGTEAVDLLPSVPTGTVVQIDSITGTGFTSTSAAPNDSVRVDVPAATTVDATVWFTVLGGTPGEVEVLTLTGRLVNDGAVTDDGTAEIERGAAVSVLPDGLGSPAQANPGPGRTQSFEVVNLSDAAESYDLLATVDDGGTPILTITGIAATGASGVADSVRTAVVAPGDTLDVTVTYTVAGGASGTINDVVLTARGVNDPATTDVGRAEIERVRPAVTVLPDSDPDVLRDPGIGSFDFTVEHDALQTEAVDLRAALAVIGVVDSIRGSGFSFDGGVADSAQVDLAPNTPVTATVWFTISPGTGNEPGDLDLTARLANDAGATDDGSQVIRRGTASVSTTPDAAGTPVPVASGTSSSQLFTVENTSSFPVTFDLLASTGATSPDFVTITGVSGSGFSEAGDSAQTGSIPAGGTVDVTVDFDVAAGAFGDQQTLVLTARAVDDPAVSDPGTILVERASVVDVLPDGGPTPIDANPGTGLTQIFTVENRSGSAESWDILATVDPGSPAFVTITGLSATGATGTPDSIRTSPLADGDTLTVTVTYSVAPGATTVGTDDIDVIARSVTQPANFDEGSVSIRRVRPTVTVTPDSDPDIVRDPGVGSFDFTVQHDALQTETVDLRATLTTIGAIDSIRGSGFAFDVGVADSAQVVLAPSTPVTATVWFTISEGTGGQVGSLGLTARLANDAGATDDGSQVVQRGITSVSTTPDAAGTPVLVASGTSSSQLFTVENTSSFPVAFDLLASTGATSPDFLTVTQVSGSGFSEVGDSAQSGAIPAGGTVDVTVDYDVAAGTLGDQQTLALTARALGDPSVSDPGTILVERACGTANVNVGTMAELRTAIGDPCTTIINIAPGTYDLSSSGSGELFIDRNLTIQNSSSLGQVTLDGAGASRIFQVAAGAVVSMNGLTVRNGAEGTGPRGAGIYVLGTLTFDNGAILDNASLNDGGGIATGPGGTLSMTNVTVSGNTTSDRGAGADFEGTVTLRHVTFAGNGAGGQSGGVNVRSGTVEIQNSLFADNTQGSNGQITVQGGTLVVTGGNLVEGGAVTAGGSCTGCAGLLTTDPGLTSLANNGGSSPTYALAFGSNAIDAGSAIGVGTDQRGVARPQGAAPDLGSYEFEPVPGLQVTPDGLPSPVVQSPGSGLTQDFTIFNTGPGPETFDLTVTVGTEIVPFVTIDGISGAGFSSSTNTVTTTSVPSGGSVVASVEFTVAPGFSGRTDTIRVLGALTSTPGTTDTGFAEIERGCGDPTVVVSTMSELREAIADACISTIRMNPGTYQLPSSGSGPLVVNRNLAFENTGLGEVIIDGGRASRVFEIAGGLTVTMSDFGITGGLTPGPNDDGGGILNNSGTNLTLDRMLLFANEATDDAGGLSNEGGTVTIINTTFSQNIAGDDGGGFESEGGSVSLLQVSLVGNEAGTDPLAETGGAYKVLGGATVTMANSLVSDNLQRGGQIPDPIDVDNGTVTLIGVNLIEGGCGGCSGATGSILNVEPEIQPLFLNGGLTKTHGLAPNSPAIDVAVNQGVNTDQRGVVRDVEGTGYDLGSFERQVSLSVDVTPDGLGIGNAVQRFTGASYAQDFQVSHSSGGLRDIDLFGSELGPISGGSTFLNVTAITGTGITGAADSARISQLPDGDVRTVTVIYDVLASGIEAQIDTLVLQGRLVDQQTVVDFGRAEVEWICQPGLSSTVSTVAALRSAVADACVQVINVTPGTYPLTSSGSGPLVVDRDVTIQNTGGGEVILDAGGASRVFEVGASASVAMTGLTITGGTGGGGRGGGILVSGSLDFSSGTITGNTSDDGGGIAAAPGSVLNLVNVTISGNTGTDRGGGIDTEGTTTLTHVTIANNQGQTAGAAGINLRGGTLQVGNVLVADNTGAGNQLVVQGGSLSAVGQNLVEGGCSAAACSGFLTGDPGLFPLANNGGNSDTHALNAGSIARNAGGALGVGVDQRGVARPQSGTEDIGAYEALPPATITVTPDGLPSPNDVTFGTGFSQQFTVTSGSSVTEDVDFTVTGTPSFVTVDSITSPGAMGSADSIRVMGLAPSASLNATVWFSVAPGLATVTENLDVMASFVFDGSVMDTGFAEIRRSCGPSTVTVSDVAALRDAVADPCVSTIRMTPGFYLLPTSGSGPLVIDRDLTFENTGGGEVILDGGLASRIFEIQPGVTVGISEISVNRGSTGGDGGGLLNQGTLTLEKVTFSDNTAGDDGGALYNLGGDVTMVNVTFSTNSATGDGGALTSESGSVTVTHGTFASNVSSGTASGVYLFGGTMNLRNSLVAGSGVTVASTGGTLTLAGANIFQGGCSGCTGTTPTNADPLLDPLSNYGGTTKTHRLQAASPAIDAADAAFVPVDDQRGVLRAGEGAGGDIGAYEAQASFGISVTPDGGVNVPRQSGSGYTQDFTVTNTSVGPQDIDLIVDALAPTAASTFLTINSITVGVDTEVGDSMRVVGVTSGSSVVATVNYDVQAGSFGAQIDTIQILGRIVANPATVDLGRAEVLYQCGGSFTQTVTTMAGVRSAVADPCVTEVELLPGTYDLTSSGSGPIVVDRDLIFTNGGLGEVVLDAQGVSRVFEIDPGTTVSMDGLTIADGAAPGQLGGGIQTSGALTFTNGTITGNTAAQGGGIDVTGTGSLVMVNATISGNQSTTRGGAMNLAGNATLTHVTVAFNSSNGPTGGLNITGGTTTIRNTLIGDNTQISGPQIIVQAGGLVANGVNLVEGGCAATACSGAVTADPELDVLANYGGSSRTHRLQVGSPAIDAAANLGIAVDQRGDPRPRGAGFDIGAFERIASYAVDVVAVTGTASELPSNLEPSYVGSYTVSNVGSIPSPYTLIASTSGAAVAIDSIRGPGVTSGARADSAQTALLTAGGGSVSIDVYYRVLDVAEGESDPIELLATSTSSPGTADSAQVVLTVIRPVLSFTKAVVVTGGNAQPGAELQYTISALNLGSADAFAVTVLDSLPAEVDFKVGSVSTTLPGGIVATLETLDATQAPVTPTSEGGGAPIGFDARVRYLRWTLSSPLPFTEQADFAFAVRIR